MTKGESGVLSNQLRQLSGRPELCAIIIVFVMLAMLVGYFTMAPGYKDIIEGNAVITLIVLRDGKTSYEIDDPTSLNEFQILLSNPSARDRLLDDERIGMYKIALRSSMAGYHEYDVELYKNLKAMTIYYKDTEMPCVDFHSKSIVIENINNELYQVIVQLQSSLSASEPVP